MNRVDRVLGQDGVVLERSELFLVGLTDVLVSRLDAIPAVTTTFEDEPPEGRFDHAVSAIDRYGVDGAPDALEVALGDTTPPAAPPD